MTELDLRETLQRRLDAVDVPPAQLGPVVVAGRRRRRRRSAAAVSATLALVAGTAAGARLLVDDAGRGVDDSRYAALGALDFSQGARAYSDGRQLHLAGRTFPAGDLDYLDTDAVATSYGMVFYDDGRPMLLGADGEIRALTETRVDHDFRPGAKWDPVRDQVAVATRSDSTVTLAVLDLPSGDVARTRELACGGDCEVVVDAADDGDVVVRVGDETFLWGEDSFERIGGAEVRVADLRGGVLLWSGRAPDVTGFRLVEGGIDATLTFDGRYVLDWSSRLRATDGGPDLVLEQGPRKQGALGFWAVDSDGSVLVAREDGYPEFTVFDCQVVSMSRAPAGTCTELGPLVSENGDPQFIGVDI